MADCKLLKFTMERMTFSFERFSLTPALSRQERENNPPIFGRTVRRARSYGQGANQLEQTHVGCYGMGTPL
jgi:hypothetical protein